MRVLYGSNSSLWSTILKSLDMKRFLLSLWCKFRPRYREIDVGMLVYMMIQVRL